MKNLSVMILTAACGLFAQAQDSVSAFAVGAFTVNVLSEGNNTGNSALLVGATDEMLRKYLPDGTFPMGVNAFLVRTPDKKIILVDAGYGRKLPDNLKALKVKEEQVDVILLTHMHGDHIGGLLKDGKTVFPNAELYLSQPEHDYWTSDSEMQAVRENRRGGFLQARSVIKAYGDRLHLFVPAEHGKPATCPFPEIQGIAAYGHTPGHTAYLLESEGERLLIWGDLTHAMKIQMPLPEVALSFDVHPAQAVAIRKALLEYAARNGIAVAGMHIASPGMGKIRKSTTKGESYVFEPF
ncbi:MAG: MBL fold metallo-hydrolase [Bacteroidales bacterium]|jgi:glyoxylase-like metal-dependent hydrolase (beta-lactamase superfamily II)|nr:MBL fold metallo-hydrolase [Bacteroidales bacterium]